MRRRCHGSLGSVTAAGWTWPAACDTVGWMEPRQQPERLLQVILDGTPAAMVLVGETGGIVFTNAAARQLFFEGREAKGENFLQMLAQRLRAAATRAAVRHRPDLHLRGRGRPETYHLSPRRHFVLDDEPHTLITRPAHDARDLRQEIAVLKKTLRIIGHELGNSMAPASSLLRSARQMLSRPELHASLDTALETVEERLGPPAGRLSPASRTSASCPSRRKREVAWPDFLDGLRALWPDVVIAPPPAAARLVRPGADPAGADQPGEERARGRRTARRGRPSRVEAAPDGGVRFAVLDRGPGMSDEVMDKALDPFVHDQGARAAGMGLSRSAARSSRRTTAGCASAAARARGRWSRSGCRRVRPEPPEIRARLTLTGVR